MNGKPENPAAGDTSAPAAGETMGRTYAWPPVYLDVGALAHLLSASRKRIQRMLARGALPPADINISGGDFVKGRRWKRERVVTWLEAQAPAGDHPHSAPSSSKIPTP